jgi:hypothetical protein
VSGKVAWFAVPLAPGSPAASPPQIVYSPAEAAKKLGSQLDARGITQIIQNDLPGRSLLSVPHSMVWTDANAYTWRNGAQVMQHPHADLNEAVEQLVRIHQDSEYCQLRTS